MARPAIALLLLGLIFAGLLVPGMLRGQRDGELVFERESVDLGQVPLDVRVPFRFNMRNAGSSPVNIVGKVNVKAVEGC